MGLAKLGLLSVCPPLETVISPGMLSSWQKIKEIKLWAGTPGVYTGNRHTLILHSHNGKNQFATRETWVGFLLAVTEYLTETA